MNGLIPNHYIEIEKHHEIEHKYKALHNKAIDSSDINKKLKNKKYISYHNGLDERTIKNIKNKYKDNLGPITDTNIYAIIKQILNESVDETIKEFFNSNYAILFYSLRKIDSESNSNPSTKWHCDNSPPQSLMIMCYLESDEQHESSTLFLEKESTDKLKEIGYIYNNIEHRKEDLSEIFEAYNIDNKIHRHSFKPGETIVFSATDIAHKAQLPKIGRTRTTIDICVIPSPVNWEKTIKVGFIPPNKAISFNMQAQKLMNITDTHNSKNGTNRYKVIKIGSQGNIYNSDSLKFHLNTIFKDQEFSDFIYNKLNENPINYDILTISELVVILKKSFRDGLKWDTGFNITDITRLSDIIEFEKSNLTSLLKFADEGKTKPEAVKWPIPNHPKYPNNKYDMFPYVSQHKIMDKNTPIGSAGSCFAVEIAKILQEENYNYVVTELGDRPMEEAIIDGYEQNSGIAMYSANFGILFNTPSLRQLSEKAFKERTFTKYLVEAENGLLMDPYRENVYFRNEECFINDYPKHIEAIRQVLLQSEVFIFTAGLNECWQLKDGTVMSRNPRNGFHHLMEHKVLTVQENVDNIINFFESVKRHNKNFKLILTLSPIPLLATGRANEHHIIEANTHSKSVLRVAIDEAVKYHSDIYYLPSYELVTECIKNPWEEDHRHVTKETVKKVIQMFKEIFVKD